MGRGHFFWLRPIACFGRYRLALAGLRLGVALGLKLGLDLGLGGGLLRPGADLGVGLPDKALYDLHARGDIGMCAAQIIQLLESVGIHADGNDVVHVIAPAYAWLV